MKKRRRVFSHPWCEQGESGRKCGRGQIRPRWHEEDATCARSTPSSCCQRRVIRVATLLVRYSVCAGVNIGWLSSGFSKGFHQPPRHTHRPEVDESVSERYVVGYVPLRWLPHPHQEGVGEDLGGGRTGAEGEERDHRE